MGQLKRLNGYHPRYEKLRCQRSVPKVPPEVVRRDEFRELEAQYRCEEKRNISSLGIQEITSKTALSDYWLGY